MAMDRPWPWTVHGHGQSMAMDCPWPWTVHGHGQSMAMEVRGYGQSMAMDSPWPWTVHCSFKKQRAPKVSPGGAQKKGELLKASE